MRKSDVARIIAKRCRRLQRQQEGLFSASGAEAAHNFRVEVKKLRALLRLLQHCQENKHGIQIPKSLQSLYRAVGDVRSLQLQHELVHVICTELSFPVPVGYVALLLSKEKEAIKAVKDKVSQTSFTRLRHQLLKSLPLTGRLGDAETFLEHKRVQLLTCLTASGLTTDEVLHDIRKILKDLLYVWPWIAETAATALSATLFSKNTCLQLAEQLGLFQDYCVALLFFNPAYLINLNAEERKVMAAVEQEFLRRKEKQKHSIADTLLQMRRELQANKPVQQIRPVAASEGANELN